MSTDATTTSVASKFVWKRRTAPETGVRGWMECDGRMTRDDCKWYIEPGAAYWTRLHNGQRHRLCAVCAAAEGVS